MVAEAGDQADLYVVHACTSSGHDGAPTEMVFENNSMPVRYEKAPILWPDNIPGLRRARTPLTSHTDGALYFSTNAGVE